MKITVLLMTNSLIRQGAINVFLQWRSDPFHKIKIFNVYIKIVLSYNIKFIIKNE